MGTFYGEGSQVAASQAHMEAATSNIANIPVTPLGVNWHPGVAKAWISCNQLGNILASYNITSITDGGIGLVTVTIATDFSSAEYCIVGTALIPGTGNVYDVKIDTQSAGSFIGKCINDVPAPADPDRFHFACFGDQ